MINTHTHTLSAGTDGHNVFVININLKPVIFLHKPMNMADNIYIHGTGESFKIIPGVGPKILNQADNNSFSDVLCFPKGMHIVSGLSIYVSLSIHPP